MSDRQCEMCLKPVPKPIVMHLVDWRKVVVEKPDIHRDGPGVQICTECNDKLSDIPDANRFQIHLTSSD